MTLMPLHAGPLTAFFDIDTAFLRYVRWNNHEIVRAVFAAIRDHNWDTIPYSLEQLEIRTDEEAFQITFRATCRHESIQFFWQGRISGSPDGSIQFSFLGESENSFLRNRIGLCVLHPIVECSGLECTVGHSDGSRTEGVFPRWISPHQPFKQMRSISHPVGNQARAHIRFEGEVFEMEDQRNWSDASFKTYCTPLELPFPVRIEAGTKIQQSVTIELERLQTDKSVATVLLSTDAGKVCLRVNCQSRLRRPAIGFWLSDPAAHHHPAVVARLRQIGPEHLRVDVDLAESDWEPKLATAIELARQISAALEVALFTEQVGGLAWQRLAGMLQADGVNVARCLLFHPMHKTTPDELAEAACRSIMGLDSRIPLGVGSDAYFAEFNRGTPRATASKLVCFSINPQVHAFDNLSLRETLEALPALVQSAHRLSDARVVVSPVSLRPRFNPNATAASPSRAEQLDLAIDPRQATGFGAAWTAGALAALITQPELDSLTFYEASGPRGVLSSDGQDYPMTEVFERLLASSTLCAVDSSSPLDVRALGFVTAEGPFCLCLANLSASRQVVDIVADQSTQRREVTLEPESVYFLTLLPS
jgi:D-apionolactonase